MPFGGLLTAFLLGSTAFLSFFNSNACQKHPPISSNARGCVNHENSLDDLWNTNSNLLPQCPSLFSATDIFIQMLSHLIAARRLKFKS
jgi:hypothetical protein